MAAEPSETATAPEAGPPASVPAAPVVTNTPHWTEQEAAEADEDELADGDSALGDDAASTTASLSASILEYRTIHGRTYHSLQGTADHWTPNDDAHLESMDCVHHCLTLLLENKLYLAPIADGPIKVLDIGCGTGIWAIDFADAHPSAEVTGTDISVIQPEWVPPNLKFEIEDCTQPWTYAPDGFDYVHMRYLFGAISDWDSLIGEAFKVCRPGGWVEITDPSVNMRSDDGSVREGTAFYEWGLLFNEASSKYGRAMDMVDRGTTLASMKKTGFVDIHRRTFKLPTTPWPRDQRLKQLGAFCRLAMEQDLDGYAMYLFMNGLGWSQQQVAIFLARVRKEMRDPRVQPYFLVEVLYGRKPE